MRKIISAVLVLIMLVTGLSACKKAEEKGKEAPKAKATATAAAEKTDYEKLYADVLKEYYNIIKNAETLEEYAEEKIGVVETAQYLGAEALNQIGYLLKDINGDDVPELLIGESSDEEYAYTKNNLYAVYTVKNKKPHFVLDGRSRSMYSLMENGNFYYGGSNGAAYRIFGEYVLDKNGELKCIDFNFSYEKDDSFEEIGFYHNTTGVYEKAEAEEMNISDDEFWAMEDAFAAKTVKLEFTPFSALKTDNTETGESAVKTDTKDLCGKWTGYSQTPDGNNYILFVDILADGTASYRCGPPQSEILVNYNGKWTADATGKNITLVMTDSYEGGSFDGTYEWSVNGNELSLRHIGGDTFLYETEGRTFSFTR